MELGCVQDAKKNGMQ